MHRSGTSLVTSVLQNAGLYIGSDISGSGHGNLRGHFEDRDFYRLHENMFAAAGETCFSAGDDFAPPATSDFLCRARALVTDREEHPLWGWKDPRTCLFLEFWHPLLPDARYLFLYRHPVDVALSLWRRNNDLELWQNPWMAVRAWEVYNRRLLDFRKRYPGRTFLAQIPAATTDFSDLVRCLRVQLEVPLHDACAASLFVPEELAPLTPAEPSEWEKLIPSALALYRQLEESADLPARERNGKERPDRERDLLQTSESLLRALLERSLRNDALSVRLQVLEAELEKERLRTAELRASLLSERQVLADIHSSRSFAPVRAWWWLRRRLNGQGT
jgi:hypothetical protein